MPALQRLFSRPRDRKLRQARVSICARIQWRRLFRGFEGYISVASEANRGTAFTIYFPGLGLHDAPEAVDAPLPPPRGHGTILIAEDNDGLRTLAIRTLQSLGYRTIAACDAVEALKLSDDFAASIDLLLTDVVSADGLELSRAVTRGRAETRVLYMSGQASWRVLWLMAYGSGRPRQGDASAFLTRPRVFEDLARAGVLAPILVRDIGPVGHPSVFGLTFGPGGLLLASTNV